MQPQMTEWDPAGGDTGENAIPTTMPNKSRTPIPPSLGPLDASESSLPKIDHPLFITSDGTDREGANVETNFVPTHERKTPGQQLAADLGPSMPTAERTLFTDTLYMEVSGHYPTICASPPHL